jgi:DNA-binding MarR family transcriptional regulator
VPASETDALKATAAAWESLFRSQVAVMRRLLKHPAFKEIGMREYDVLFNLSRCKTGWIRLNELNEHLLISQPSLSRMADRLEAKGLVQRMADPTDQRAVLLGLTPAGSELQKKIGREHVRHIHQLLTPALSLEELEQLKNLTDKLRAGL